MNWAPYRKALVAAVGGLAECLAAGALHGTAERIATGIVAGCMAAGVYQVRNDRGSEPRHALQIGEPADSSGHDPLGDR